MIRIREQLLCVFVLCAATTVTVAAEEQEPESPATESAEESEPGDFDEALDEQAIDVANSIGGAVERRGLRIDGDLRVGNLFVGDDFEDVSLGDADAIRARWRIRATWGITERFRGVIRVAGLCSTDNCDPDFILQPNIPTRSTLEDGQITLDEFFLQTFRSDRFNVALGRMQTKFVARGGVFSKSLDQNDSNNLSINWTDGLHATFKMRNAWESHMVLRYNSSDGPGTVRRSPLDFSDSASRVSYLFGFENLQEKRRLVQRALDVSYLPKSLQTTGQADGPLEDYWAIVARAAFRWPVREDSWRIRISSELGYAPNTQTKAAVGIVGAGDANGLAWNVTASVMDFVPEHSIGINYAQTEAGWLVSPQYRGNERLIELRYMWRPNDRMAVDIRGRRRLDLRQRIIEVSSGDLFDFYMRFTWNFRIRKL
jgi:hypothetical protein